MSRLYDRVCVFVLKKFIPAAKREKDSERASERNTANYGDDYDDDYDDEYNIVSTASCKNEQADEHTHIILQLPKFNSSSSKRKPAKRQIDVMKKFANVKAWLLAFVGNKS